MKSTDILDFFLNQVALNSSNMYQEGTNFALLGK